MFKNANAIFRELDNLILSSVHPQQSFPRYNIIEGEKTDTEERFTIELAVAGFTSDDITVEVRPDEHSQVGVSRLTVIGKKEKPEDAVTYIFNGITNRDFKQEFHVYDTDKVEKCKLINGILTIEVVRAKTAPNTIKIEVE